MGVFGRCAGAAVKMVQNCGAQKTLAISAERKYHIVRKGGAYKWIF
jgi:hypothetical protein